MGGIGDDFRFARGIHQCFASQQVFHRRRGDCRARPQRIDGNAARPQFPGQPQHHHAHAEFRHCIGGRGGKPFFLHVEGRRQHQDMRVLRLQQIGHGQFRDHERAARVDGMHQVVALHVGGLRIGQRYRAGIVDDNVDAAEFLRRGLQRLPDLGLFADIDEQRQGLAAQSLDVLRGGIDRAGQFGVRLGGFGGHRDIGPVARGTQGNGKANAARGTCNEQGLAFQAAGLRHGSTL